MKSVLEPGGEFNWCCTANNGKFFFLNKYTHKKNQYSKRASIPDETCEKKSMTCIFSAFHTHKSRILGNSCPFDLTSRWMSVRVRVCVRACVCVSMTCLRKLSSKHPTMKL